MICRDEPRAPQIQVEQLVDPEDAQEFFCWLCGGVLYLPMLTKCALPGLKLHKRA